MATCWLWAIARCFEAPCSKQSPKPILSGGGSDRNAPRLPVSAPCRSPRKSRKCPDRRDLRLWLAPLRAKRIVLGYTLLMLLHCHRGLVRLLVFMPTLACVLWPLCVSATVY